MSGETQPAIGVCVKAPGPSGFGTTVTNAETGEEIKGIASLNISIVPDDIIRVEAQIFLAETEVNGVARFYASDPSTGETKQLVRIEFADGTVWSA
jgi:hypothetical protein